MFREGNYKRKNGRGNDAPVLQCQVLKYPAEEGTRYTMSWRNPLAGTNSGPEGYNVCFERLRIDRSCNTYSTMPKH
jgi:hypothetical protein